jgi:sugar phosphate isomerase/epimerase
MKLGIKVGPQKQSIEDLKETNAPFAEVWFQIDKKDEYDGLFSYLKKNRIDTGLHFWGSTHDGFSPSISCNDQSYANESAGLVRQSIDIASENNFSYVVIHPGTRAKVIMDYTNETFTVLSKPTAIPIAQNLFLRAIQELSRYATKKHVVLIVETIDINVCNGWRQQSMESRYHPFPLHELPIETLIEAGSQGIAIANDFGHTAGTIISDAPRTVWTHLKTITKKLLPVTRLLHLGYIIPPFNGTDFHDHLDNPIFETPDAVPNKKQMTELLQLFKNRNDVWALAEPNGQHPKNYFLAQKLLRDAGL